MDLLSPSAIMFVDCFNPIDKFSNQIKFTYQISCTFDPNAFRSYTYICDQENIFKYFTKKKRNYINQVAVSKIDKNYSNFKYKKLAKKQHSNSSLTWER